MRDYIMAMRSVWDCWQNDAELNFESEHYNINLMVPLFNPGPIDHPRIPVHVAAIGPNMVAMAGEVADGVRLHPVCTPRFIDEEVHPNVARGAARTGRDVGQVEVCMKPLVGTAPTEEALAKVTQTVRARVAFYLSTPSYRRTFELHGWGDIAEQASRLSKQQEWESLPELVHDEMLHTVATLGTHDTIAAKLNDRYGSRVDRIEFSMPVTNPDEAETYRQILTDLHG
jgi:probable F420-dependent oxidoreductase